MGAPSSLFGGNSDGSARMEDWLNVMCRGCVKDRGRGQNGGMGGMGCLLPADAYTDPQADVTEWSTDASPRPERLAELGPGPWPVCMAHEPRKQRSDAGRTRVPAGQHALFP